MGAINDLADALAAVLATVQNVDQVSTVDFLPALSVGRAIALVVPFEQEGATDVDDLSGVRFMAHDTIRVEFWIKHDQGNPTATMPIARDICNAAIRALVTGDESGYTLDRTFQFRYRVDRGFVNVANNPWLVAHLYVPLEYEVTTP